MFGIVVICRLSRFIDATHAQAVLCCSVRRNYGLLCDLDGVRCELTVSDFTYGPSLRVELKGIIVAAA